MKLITRVLFLGNGHPQQKRCSQFGSYVCLGLTNSCNNSYSDFVWENIHNQIVIYGLAMNLATILTFKRYLALPFVLLELEQERELKLLAIVFL